MKPEQHFAFSLAMLQEMLNGKTVRIEGKDIVYVFTGAVPEHEWVTTIRGEEEAPFTCDFETCLKPATHRCTHVANEECGAHTCEEHKHKHGREE